MTTATEVDGRRLRGETSRARILEGATAVISRDGLGALTHRAAADEAGVPLARVAYHFPKIDDLLEAAATEYLSAFDLRLAGMAAEAVAGRRSMVEACTDFVLDIITTGASEFLAMVEVRVALARRGRTVGATGTIEILGAFGLDPGRAASIVASLFGFAVLAATEPTPIPRSSVKAYVGTVLGRQS
jgi:AcrR family transcriptional regulator